jgi:hypothetical protein
MLIKKRRVFFFYPTTPLMVPVPQTQQFFSGTVITAVADTESTGQVVVIESGTDNG